MTFYDKSLFVTLKNGPDYFYRDICQQSLVIIKKNQIVNVL